MSGPGKWMLGGKPPEPAVFEEPEQEGAKKRRRSRRSTPAQPSSERQGSLDGEDDGSEGDDS